MAYYITCPNCGSNLDPGERCDCQMEKHPEPEPKKKKLPRRTAAAKKSKAGTVRRTVLATHTKNA